MENRRFYENVSTKESTSKNWNFTPKEKYRPHGDGSLHPLVAAYSRRDTVR